MAARMSKVCHSMRSWNFMHWYSRLAFGSIQTSEMKKGASGWNFASLKFLEDQDDPRQNGETRTECLAKFDCYVMGPEDPQLFTMNGQIYVMFVGSDLVKPLPGMECGKNNMYCRPKCSEHGMRPHIAPVHSVYPELKLGASFPAQVNSSAWIDKNWGLFSFAGPGSPEKLLGVYWIHPHTIIELDMSTGRGTVAHETRSPLIEKLANQLDIRPERFHNGPTPQLLRPCPFKKEISCYFGVLHALREGFVTIGNWPYLFLGKPPFEIIRVGKKLALAYGRRTQFVSSIVIAGGNLKLAYNADDADSCVYETPLNEFINTYF